MERNFSEFLICAKKSTYSDKNAAKVKSLRDNSKDYEFSKIVDGKKYVYHDSYFGFNSFIGEETVSVDGVAVWGMNYFGAILDGSTAENIYDEVLRPALCRVDGSSLPVRGAEKFAVGEYLYTFEAEGDIGNFSGTEKIYKSGRLVYKLICHGGKII